MQCNAMQCNAMPDRSLLTAYIASLPPSPPPNPSAPEYFDASTVARDLGDNWALKSSNLRKLLRNLETYYSDALAKSVTDLDGIDLSAIAREGDAAGLASLIELVAAAAVQCDHRGEIVPRIMSMSPAAQVEMKGVIEASMARLEDLDGGDGDGSDGGSGSSDDDGGGGGGDGEFDSDEYDSDGEGAMAAMFSAAEHNMDGAMVDAGVGGSALLQERDDLRQSLQDARRELAGARAAAEVATEEHEAAERKLRALAEDLQERLGRRQEELTAAEEEAVQVRRARDDAELRASDLQEKCASLADELDVASAKATQLTKAEATVVAYRRKLEGVQGMNQQMTELEDQSAKYLSQIMELEADAKKVPGLQRTVNELQTKAERLEKKHATAGEDVQAKAADVARLKQELSAAEAAKRMFEEELATLRAQADGGADVSVDDVGVDLAGMAVHTSAKSVTEAKAKALQLEKENSRLREQLEEMEKAAAAAPPPPADDKAATAETWSRGRISAVGGGSPAEPAAGGGGGGGVSSLEVARLKGRISKLEKTLKQREAEKAKLGSDKEKLEAYTKKTLSKFQEKYLVALQECKAKLKEKHDKIEALEMRSQSERTAQKREERLLSSTVYELGLAIMQQRLKDR